jgi:transposase
MNGFEVTDELWKRIEPLLPPRENPHPRGGGRKPVDDRKVINAIFFILRTGAQWKSLDATGICSGSTAHLRFQKWAKAGVFEKLWEAGLLEYDKKSGLGWRWQSMDGAMTKAPLGGEKNRDKPDRPRKMRDETKPADRRERDSAGGNG